jgi:hypothetical protein
VATAISRQHDEHDRPEVRREDTVQRDARGIGGPYQPELNLARIGVAEDPVQAYAVAVVFTVPAMTAATMYSMEIAVIVSHSTDPAADVPAQQAREGAGHDDRGDDEQIRRARSPLAAPNLESALMESRSSPRRERQQLVVSRPDEPDMRLRDLIPYTG